MSDILPRKRTASAEQPAATMTAAKAAAAAAAAPDPPAAKSKNSKLYNTLLSILAKSLIASREKVASDAPRTIEESYGDMTSLFASSDDDDGNNNDGVSSLVDLLLGKLDSVHDRFNSERLAENSVSPSNSSSSTRLERLLQQQTILEMLQKLEASVDQVEEDEREFHRSEEADKSSAREAIKLAKSSTRISPGGGKKRRIMPAEAIGYHAHKLKAEYQQSLQRELEDVERENETKENEMKERWGEWRKRVGGIKDTLHALDNLAGEGTGR